MLRCSVVGKWTGGAVGAEKGKLIGDYRVWGGSRIDPPPPGQKGGVIQHPRLVRPLIYAPQSSLRGGVWGRLRIPVGHIEIV
jgi:hypothetical protein